MYTTTLVSGLIIYTSVLSPASGTLTTSILFTPDQPGYVEASIINVNQDTTTMGINCPQSGDQCAFIDGGNDTFTLTEGPAGAGTTYDFAYTTPFISANPIDSVTFEGSGKTTWHCELDGTATGACTLNDHTPLTELAPGLSRTTDFSSVGAVATLALTDITMMQVRVTAGQEKLKATATSNAVGNDHWVGMGMMGAMIVGVLGFATLA